MSIVTTVWQLLPILIIVVDLSCLVSQTVSVSWAHCPSLEFLALVSEAIVLMYDLRTVHCAWFSSAIDGA